MCFFTIIIGMIIKNDKLYFEKLIIFELVQFLFLIHNKNPKNCVDLFKKN